MAAIRGPPRFNDGVIFSRIPAWNVLPAHSDADTIITDCFSPWLKRPDLVQASPDSLRPIDLLYGSKQIFLVNTIHESTRYWPLREPERLAGGWLMYYFIRWLMRPSKHRFALLQDFQRPVPEQLQHTHPYFVDLIIIPQLRANMIRHPEAYDPAEAVGMLSCCLKLKWPCGKNILEPDDQGHLQMRQDFYETFIRLDGWGFTDEFVKKYASLVEGLDINFLHYRIA